MYYFYVKKFMKTRLSKSARHQQLLAVAATHILEVGADRLTLATVAQQAGVSKPIAYDHFGSKQGLLLALFGHLEAGYTDTLNQAFALTTLNLDQRIELLIHTYMDCMAKTGALLEHIQAGLQSQIEAQQHSCYTDLLNRSIDGLTPYLPTPINDLRAKLIIFFAAAESACTLVRSHHLTEPACYALLHKTLNGLLGLPTSP